MVTDVDVLAAVLPQGEAEALAGAAQAGGNQLGRLNAQQTSLGVIEQAELDQTVNADAQLLLIDCGAEAQGLLELGDRQGVVEGKLVEQVGDRELHRQLQLGLAGELAVSTTGPEGRLAAGRGGRGTEALSPAPEPNQFSLKISRLAAAFDRS